MSYRNRCHLAGAEGVIHLSIPLQKGRDQKTLVKDVRIADRNDWQSRHWKTIVSCYSRSPWFEYYRDELGDLYRRPFHFLVDWNLACFEWSLKILQMPISFSLTTAYQKSYVAEQWTDWRGAILPKNQHVDPDRHADNTAPIKYRQVFEERTGFLPNLSILDLLFCEGKNARVLLQKDAQKR